MTADIDELAASPQQAPDTARARRRHDASHGPHAMEDCGDRACREATGRRPRGKFFGPGDPPMSVTLTAVTVAHPTRPGQWLPGLYWQAAGDEYARSAILILPGLTLRAGDFEHGARITVTVETAKEGSGG